VDGFVDRRGAMRAAMGRRRLRMWPEDFGNSCYFESIPLDDIADAVDSVARLLVHLSYRGAFSAELKLDLDGVHKLLEVNVRPWWYVEFAARCGVDVPRMMYDDALGRDVAPVASYQVGRRMVYPFYDFFAARRQFEAGTLPLGDWVESWLSADRAILAFDDPRPWIRDVGAWVGRMVRSRVARLFG
jgi:predicted ATP-grasp superfamily ATP-dependent carboligase